MAVMTTMLVTIAMTLEITFYCTENDESVVDMRKV